MTGQHVGQLAGVLLTLALVAAACADDAAQPEPPAAASSASNSAAAESEAAEPSDATSPTPEFDSLKGPRGATLFTSLDGTHTLAIGPDWVLEEPADLATWTVPLAGGGSTRVNIIPEAGHSDEGMKGYLDYAIESIRGSVDKLTVLDTQISVDSAGHELGRLDVRAKANGRLVTATSFVKIFGDTAYTVGIYSEPGDHAAALQQLEPYLTTLSGAN